MSNVQDVNLLNEGRAKFRVSTCGLCLLGVGVVFGAGLATAVLASSYGFASMQASQVTENVDFSFQIMGIQTPRQGGKIANVFVRFRYNTDPAHCPYSSTDNVCIQYQYYMRSTILNIVMNQTEDLPLPAEWERVNLAICRNLYAKYPNVVALSTAFHVNGDGRPADERGSMPWEPGAHGSTCTIGPTGLHYEPIHYLNHLPNLGPLR